MKTNLFVLYFIFGIVLLLSVLEKSASQENDVMDKKLSYHIISDQSAWSKAENELWNLENSYMISYMKKDIENLSKFYHEKFIAWPSWSQKPLDKKTALSVLSQSEKSNTDLFKIHPQKITIFDSTAVVHYLIDIMKANKENVLTYRITHTWSKQTSSWKILGGMSAETKRNNK